MSNIRHFIYILNAIKTVKNNYNVVSRLIQIEELMFHIVTELLHAHLKTSLHTYNTYTIPIQRCYGEAFNTRIYSKET